MWARARHIALTVATTSVWTAALWILAPAAAGR